MIQQFDAHDFPGFPEFVGEINVIPACLRRSAGWLWKAMIDLASHASMRFIMAAIKTSRGSM